MRRRKRWLVPTMLVGAASAWMWYRRGDLGRLAGNLHRYSAPSASLYDTVTAPLLGGFFTRVAHDLAELGPRARVLEVGSGPGRLAVKLAEVVPAAEITGVDIAPEMVQRASSLAGSSGMTDRLVFRVGDVTALPFPDASFDAVVSTIRAAGGVADTAQVDASYTALAGEDLLKQLEAGTMLHRLPSLTEAGELAAFLASDHARSITAAGVNITSGAVAN